ncbi:MAG TPA: methyl-accepting chemotaxis protein [Noviherbaspirillum sp.]|uniref:methyl-accepting chemotaxis protein n=1 Tax=Noviherbaspirillum sp. TaxID=1926288 RepID=UPI002D68DA0C|nr:methyl-accepting chemotaxis protein [Noviherbaspirillum sp.]HYD95854.1 methyl-accepting chemotaxis protein [Noviherbaspirillum sp.]
MKFIESMKVGTRLAVGFGTVLVLMTVLTGVAISRMGFIRASLDGIVQDDAAKLRLVNAMRDLVRYQSVTVRDVVMQEDFAFKKKELLLARQSKETYRAAAAELDKLLTDTQGGAALAKIARLDARALAAMDKAVDLSLSGDKEAAAAMIRDEVRPAQIELIGALEALLQQVEAESRRAADDAGQTYRNAVAAMMLVGGLALLVGVAAAVLITRNLLRQLGGEPDYAGRIAGRIAAGDLAVDIPARQGDHGSLMFAMKEMRDSLARIVGEVRSGTDAINNAAEEIASGNLDLSSRTEQQAGALEESASSMEELTSIVRQNADNARQADALANSAAEVARKGGNVVSEVVRTMGAINDSARRIADIIGVIDGIAFQTNILALNAAVEAARAGEQGRGFAVVASEVRALAQRSAAAAREIKSLIDDSVDKVGAGARLVDTAGSTMNDIVDSVGRVTQIIGEIAAAGVEQASRIAQVNGAVSQMDQVTQQNAALVEQSAAAAASMREQAARLSQMVGVFRLDARQLPVVQKAQARQDPPRRASVVRPPDRVLPPAPLQAPRAMSAPRRDRSAEARRQAVMMAEWEEF